MARPVPAHIDTETLAEPLSEESLRIRDAAAKAAPRAIAEHKAAGRTIYYKDPAYPGCTIEELADGRRFLTRRGPAPEFARQIIREIPAR
jgi:hypothetical protein